MVVDMAVVMVADMVADIVATLAATMEADIMVVGIVAISVDTMVDMVMGAYVHLDLGNHYGGVGGYHGYGRHHDYHHYSYPLFATALYSSYGYLDSPRPYCEYYQVANTQVGSDEEELPNAEELTSAIEQTVAKPISAPAHFVRGYQYGYLGHHKTALRELTRTLELESRDQLAVELIGEFGGTVPEQATQSTEVEDQDAEHPKASENSEN